MKKMFWSLILIGGLGVGTAWTATKDFTFSCRTKIIRDGHAVYEVRPYTYTFRVEVISDDAGTKGESWKDGKPFVTAVPEERYSIRLHNPMPVRIGVNLTVDGLSSITGGPVSPSKGKKWIIQPNSYVTIRGWQVSGDDSRRFFFTSKDASYAQWRSNSWGKDLSVNCGVIGAAYFWSKDEMQEWLDENPIYKYTYREDRQGLEKDEISARKSQNVAPSAEGAPRPQAGTGMGEHESHPVRHVDFHYDTGMYRVNQAVIIYYDFPPTPPPPPKPNPFPGGYAPEMP